MCDHLCPIIASFDAAEKVIAEYAELHEDPKSNLGIIAINRRCAEQIQEIHPCPGPSENHNGNVHCPLSGMIGDAYALAAYRPAPALIPPEKVVDATADKATGQYL